MLQAGSLVTTPLFYGCDPGYNGTTVTGIRPLRGVRRASLFDGDASPRVDLSGTTRVIREPPLLLGLNSLKNERMKHVLNLSITYMTNIISIY